ncbi:MerR family transcriptional regulator [Thiorhodovibrio frisius]|uniref:Putative transcriptional regulator n=1 Tax=Thiorhodovibrio frisius TaxID=631362 RepID=H8YW36_9GAMM|nr:MerR family transcriptional regulator [Thiorhodovibrio frisius]EIC23827.1 putative transcriptional regulator [Thiorhodovibrio frisius]WPL22989.1 Cd(II)/Pb(II)-responsive transcriptional regulator [Thiorhodovibrio frisius]
MDDGLDINTLSRDTGINVRTIRYYLAEGLLPPPSGRGPAASYGPGHCDRLRLIRRLQEAHLPLAAIRTQLEALDDAAVAAALTAPTRTEDRAPATASEYVRQVLASGSESGAAPTSSAPSTMPTSPRHQPRSTWERIVLHPDLELHVRRPLARADQRRLDKLLEQAQLIFGAKH